MTEKVTREVELAIGTGEAWERVTRADHLGSWLDAEVELELRPAGRATFRFADGEVRWAMVEAVDEGRGFEFRWWPARDHAAASRVAIELVPVGTGTRVRVTETRLTDPAGDPGPAMPRRALARA